MVPKATMYMKNIVGIRMLKHRIRGWVTARAPASWEAFSAEDYKSTTVARPCKRYPAVGTAINALLSDVFRGGAQEGSTAMQAGVSVCLLPAICAAIPELVRKGIKGHVQARSVSPKVGHIDQVVVYH